MYLAVKNKTSQYFIRCDVLFLCRNNCQIAKKYKNVVAVAIYNILIESCEPLTAKEIREAVRDKFPQYHYLSRCSTYKYLEQICSMYDCGKAVKKIRRNIPIKTFKIIPSRCLRTTKDALTAPEQ